MVQEINCNNLLGMFFVSAMSEQGQRETRL